MNEIPDVDLDSNQYLTLVYDVSGMSIDEIKALTENARVRYLAWGHIPYRYRELQKHYGGEK